MSTPGSQQLTKDNPARTIRDATILQQRLDGGTVREIAAAVGCDKGTVSKVLNSGDIKSIIEQAQKKLIDDSLETVVANQIRKIELGRQILSKESGDKHNAIGSVKDKDLLELADKAETRIMQSIGIAPAHTQSQVFLAISNQINNLLAPEVLDLLQRRATDTVIDIDLDLPEGTSEGGDGA